MNNREKNARCDVCRKPFNLTVSGVCGVINGQPCAICPTCCRDEVSDDSD